MNKKRQLTIEATQAEYRISFFAMASPCEVLIETKDKVLVNKIAEAVTNEVWRIEDKYSRYDNRSVCSQINQSNGQAISIDNETYLLLNFANVCYELSDGLFDITSGVLRRIWVFNGSDNIPTQGQIDNILPHVGWSKLTYNEELISLPKGMEIDFGGIGKEYAVDRCILLIKDLTNVPTLVNLGGDLATTKPRTSNKPWVIGVEHPGFESETNMIVSLFNGALATSGDAKRFLFKNGVRYNHILNAQTGWPITEAPRSITVASEQCVQAGILATLSLLQGANAESYLEDQYIKFWAVR